MSRLLCCTLALLCAMLIGPSFASAQPVGGPPRYANPPVRSQRQEAAREPGPSAEDFLRLLFPPDDGQDYRYDESRSGDRQVVRAAQRPIPSAASVARMTSLEQRGLLRQAVASLEQELGKLSYGAGWNNFLRVESLGSALWGQSSPSPDSTHRNILKEIAEQFDAVKQNAEYSMISNLWGFRVAQVALPLYSQSAGEKDQKRLGASVSSFDGSLDRIRFGTDWKQHFQTDVVKRLATQKEQLSESDEDVLRMIRRRFEEVKQNDKYRVIKALRGYSETRDLLRQIVEAIEAERKQSLSKSVLRSIAASKDATGLERTIIATLKKLAEIKLACSAESEAKIQAALSKKILALAPADQKKELARKANEAAGILQLATDRHDQAMSDTEKNLQAVLRLIKAGKQQQQEGETVLVLPLEDMVQVLPPEDSQEEADQIEVLAPEDSRKKEKEIEVLAPENSKKKEKKTEVLAPED